MFFLGSVTEADAKGVARDRFTDMIQEYAYKLVIPEIQFKDEKIRAEDMSNLRAQLIAMIEDFPESRDWFANFVQSDHEIRDILLLDAFTSDLIKFEDLTKSDVWNVYTCTGDRINKYSLILRYARNFNVKPMPPFARKLLNNHNISKNIMDEYNVIMNDFYSITDETSLKIKGPSIIQRSEDILTRDVTTNILDEFYAGILYDRSTRVTMALKYGIMIQIPSDLFFSEYKKNIDSIYRRVKISDYKFASIRPMSNLCSQENKYDELLNYYLFVKKDTFNTLKIRYKYSLLFLICELVKSNKLPIQESYFNIGYSNAQELLPIVDVFPDIDNDARYITKLAVRANCIAEILAKYAYIDEALFELEYILKSPPPGSYIDNFNNMIKELEKRKSELLPNAISYPNQPILSFENPDNNTAPTLPENSKLKIYAIPYSYKTKNIKKLMIKSNIKLPKNFSAKISFVPLFEDDDNVSKFMNTYKYKHLREENRGFIVDETIVNSITIHNINDNGYELNFLHTSFGGDKYILTITSNPPYNYKNSITLEIWKQYKLKLYGTTKPDGSIILPNIEGLKEKYDVAYVDFIIEKCNDKLPYHENIFIKKPINISGTDIYYEDYINELEQYEVDFTYQNEFLNIIGVNCIYNDNNITNDPLWGFYTVNTPYKIAFISCGKIRENNYVEIKTIGHEIGHAFGLIHYNTPNEYNHIGNDCILNQTQTTNVNMYKNLCDNCTIVVRNLKINTELSYMTLPDKQKNKKYLFEINNKNKTLYDVFIEIQKKVTEKILIGRNILDIKIDINIDGMYSLEEILKYIKNKTDGKFSYIIENNTYILNYHDKFYIE